MKAGGTGILLFLILLFNRRLTEGCHNALDGSHSLGRDISHASVNDTEAIRSLLAHHNLEENVILCVLDRLVALHSRRKRDLQNMNAALAAAGPMTELVKQCENFLPLCQSTQFCMENLPLHPPVAVFGRTGAHSSHNRTLKLPIFSAVPGPLHTPPISYCQNCSKSHCRKYWKCKLRIAIP